ncbi:MAG: cupin domain-containing protein [Deltaproteobacteria bacterium]|nr:cupin domain-containing protein [Deltaproteobacteria bacterium]
MKTTKGARPDNESAYIPGDRYHQDVRRAYEGELGWAANKKARHMAKVVYEAPHENVAESGIKRGSGRDFATWVLSEEAGTKEGIFSTKLELVIDATLEPSACIGLHRHLETEEIYYILEGSLTMTTVAPEGDEHTETLEAGDAHCVKLGQGHYGRAGPEGCRFVAVAVRK